MNLEAETMYTEAITINETSLAPNHPDLATSYNNWGLWLANQVRKTKSFPKEGRRGRMVSLLTTMVVKP